MQEKQPDSDRSAEPDPSETQPVATQPSLRTHWRSLALALAVSFAVAGWGSSLTVLDDWYFQLKQPAWKPPDAAFGLIWSVIFTLCAVSAWLGWHAITSPQKRRQWLVLWALNAFFNVFWSLIYFTWRRPDWSMAEVPFLWLSILALVLFVFPHRRRAAVLLLPYLAWVSAAAVLNYDTIALNGPFV